MSSSIASSIKSDPRNLAWCYEQELAWKRGRLKVGHQYLQDLAKNGPQARQICGAFFVDLCSDFVVEHGRIPSMLDVGCGPVTLKHPLIISASNHAKSRCNKQSHLTAGLPFWVHRPLLTWIMFLTV